MENVAGNNDERVIGVGIKAYYGNLGCSTER
jgi:hypothetical protein